MILIKAKIPLTIITRHALFMSYRARDREKAREYESKCIAYANSRSAELGE